MEVEGRIGAQSIAEPYLSSYNNPTLTITSRKAPSDRPPKTSVVGLRWVLRHSRTQQSVFAAVWKRLGEAAISKTMDDLISTATV